MLRDLLNRHSLVSIPSIESSFIPKLYRRFEDFGDLTDRDKFDNFFRFIENTYFIKSLLSNPKYSSIDSEKWFHAIGDASFPEVIAAFFILHAQCDKKTIWGDKSPHYMNEISLLKQLFPEAKFIHIIRDVRDNCLSIQKTWGKSLYLSAQLWTESLKKCTNDGNRIKYDFLELTFEDLITSPTEYLERICHFLNIHYEEQMNELAAPSENYGDAKGTTKILSNNKEKWKQSLSRRQIEKIESIGYEILLEKGYCIHYASEKEGVGDIERKWLKLLDSYSRFRFDVRDKGGLMNALKYKYQINKFG